MEVNSSYINIETDQGIQAVKDIFYDQKLLQLLHINVTRNDVEFKFFLQIKGTAMGKKFAPPYANIFNSTVGKQNTPAGPQKTGTLLLFPGRHLGSMDTQEGGF